MQYFNARYARSGTLWLDRYRATEVGNERYLLTLMRYIELNPVRAGLVTDPADSPWSSYRRSAQSGSGPTLDWLTPHPEYLKLGLSDSERQQAYRQLFQTAISHADLTEIRHCAHKGWALGSERFKEQDRSPRKAACRVERGGQAAKGNLSCLTAFLFGLVRGAEG